MFIEFLSKINAFNDICLDFIMKFVQFIHVPDFLQEAAAESINLIPYLFIIFIIIEIFENYFSEEIEKLSLSSRLWGPVIGSMLASIPQCGFSVIATMLYVKRFITKGTLVAVYLATSDEAVPILLVHPEKVSVILPVIVLQIIIGVIFGYITDIIFKPEKLEAEPENIKVDECGCCNHHIHSKVTKLFIHPLKHTINIFIFILVINCLLDYSLTLASGGITKIFAVHNFWQPFVAAIVGLIPNCATSVLLVMLYIKASLSFGAMIAGLSTNAGLGLLVLFKNNTSVKDSLNIVGLLLVIAILVGVVIQFL